MPRSSALARSAHHLLLLGILALGLIANTLLAADGSPVWTNYFNGPGNGSGHSDDRGNAIAVDAGGNVFVTGWSESGGGSYDYLTIKYSAAGAPQWTNRFSGPGSFLGYPYALALDGSGNVYVTGTADFFTGGSSWDWLTIKYSTDGVALWTNRFNGTGNDDDAAVALAVDVGGNVYVTGNSVGNGSGYDFVTIKYSTAGVALWTNRFNGAANGDDRPGGMALDASGNMYVTGASAGNGGNQDYATIKYSADGVALWKNIFTVPWNGDPGGDALAVDAGGDVYVTGDSIGNVSGHDWFTIKYSTAGVALWTNLFNGTGNSDDIPFHLALDTNGNVYVTGFSTGTGSGLDWLTIKYSTAGVALWTNRFSGPGNGDDVPAALALDTNGNVYVTGGVASSGGGHLATIKYSTAGVALWTNVFNNVVNLAAANALVVDGAGNAYVTGFSARSEFNYDFVTIEYSGPPAALPPLIFVTTNGGFGFSSNQFALTLTGPAGSNAVISASADLQTWAPLSTNQMAGGILHFNDTSATNNSRRFYRANLQ